MRTEELHHVLTDQERQLEIVYLVGIWAEALLYGTPAYFVISHSMNFLLGVYLLLFMAAIPTFIRGGILKALPSQVFLAGNALMFIAISIHICKLALGHMSTVSLTESSTPHIQFLASPSLSWRLRTRLTFKDLSKSSTTCLSGAHIRPSPS
jgi:hypothetical protein